MFYIYCTKQLQVSGTYRGNLQGFASTCTAYMELVIDHCILTTLHYIYIYIVCSYHRQIAYTLCTSSKPSAIFRDLQVRVQRIWNWSKITAFLLHYIYIYIYIHPIYNVSFITDILHIRCIHRPNIWLSSWICK